MLMKCLIHLITPYFDLLPNITRKTKQLNILKPYINAELNELIREKHRLKKIQTLSYYIRKPIKDFT